MAIRDRPNHRWRVTERRLELSSFRRASIGPQRQMNARQRSCEERRSRPSPGSAEDGNGRGRREEEERDTTNATHNTDATVGTEQQQPNEKLTRWIISLLSLLCHSPLRSLLCSLSLSRFLSAALMSASSASQIVEEPLDLIRLSLLERITCKCRGGRTLKGVLHAYDQHLNMVLGEVEEALTVSEVNEETMEEMVKTTKRNIDLLFVRGDAVILISPPVRMA